MSQAHSAADADSCLATMGSVVVLLHGIGPQKPATSGDRATCRARVGIFVERRTPERAEGTATSGDVSFGAAQQRSDAENVVNLLGTATKRH